MKRLIALLLIGVFTVSVATCAVAKEMKIGFADKMKILFEYQKTKDLNAELEAESQEAKIKVENMSNDIRKIRDEMGLLSESARKEKQPEIEAKIKELNDFRREKMQEIGRKQDEGIRKITEEIGALCEQYGKKNGYDAIIDIRATLYAPSTQDMTEEILKQLNQ